MRGGGAIFSGAPHLDGAHTRTLVFSRAATSTEELGDLLRRELHAGLC